MATADQPMTEDRKSNSLEISPWLPVLLAGALGVTLALAVINWLAYTEEEAVGMLYLLPFWLAGAGYFAYLLLTVPRQLQATDDRLQIRWWWHTVTVPVDQVTAVNHGRYHLVLKTTTARYPFSSIYPNHVPQLLTWLEDYVPAAAAARTARLQRTLPISLTPRLTAPLTMGGMAAIFAIVGGLLLWLNVRGINGEPPAYDWLQVVMGLFMIGLAALFAYIIGDSYVWRITLDEEAIALRHTFHRDTYPAKMVTNMALVTEARTVKGFVHPIYILRLSLMDGTAIDIAPNLPSFPMDYAGAEEARVLGEVHAMLKAHYLPVVTTELEPATFVEARWGVPAAAYQWQIRPYDLTVTRLDYGEHHAAASTVHILIGHAEAGAMRFRTTNGEIRVSPDGRFVVLYDATLLLAFNLQNGRTYHRSSRAGWLYHQAQIKGDELLIEEMKRTNWRERVSRKPISLTSPTSALRRGFGRAEGGDFPSAYG